MTKRFLTVTTVAFILAGHSNAQTPVNYADKVNTLIGNEGKGHNVNERYLEAGYTFPGALYPMGLVQFTPTFFEADRGFVVNQLSGAGCDHMGNFPMLPLHGELKESPKGMTGYKPSYKVQKAVAGYYKASLFNDIQAALTVTKRTGMAQFTFPAGDKRATVVIGSGTNATKLSEAYIKITGPGMCEGYADGGSFCGIEQPVNYRVYFVAKFDATPVASGTWKDDKISSEKSATGPGTGAYFTFNVSAKKVINYKFAISYVSLANAKQNLAAENTTWNFTTTKNKAQAAWNKYLGKIEVSGGSADLTTQFYSHLYHALAHPNISNDVNGEYIGGDYKVHKTQGFDNYTSYSNWDTYRTQIQLMALVAPKEASDVVKSTVNFANASGGGLPRWVMASTETGIMQGDPTSIVIANAYAFGATDFDVKEALTVMRRGAEAPGTKSQDRLTRPQLEQYLEKGYCDASRSLEYTSADFAIGQFALQALDDKATYNKYLERSRWWKNLYDPSTKWLRSRNADGSWKGQNDDMREASYKSYFWMVPYNLKGIIDTIGGNEAADQRLDEYFEKLNANYHQEWFAAGNEPDFQVPWTYNWIGKPWKTQVLIRRIVKEQYSNRPMGLPGNDDLGAMGAWYVFANIGLFPVVPAQGGFSVNSPAFPLVKIHLKGNKVLTIKGGSEEKPYVTALTINNKNWNNPWIPLSEVKNGGVINFTLSAQPDKTWGTTAIQPSFK